MGLLSKAREKRTGSSSSSIEKVELPTPVQIPNDDSFSKSPLSNSQLSEDFSNTLPNTLPNELLPPQPPSFPEDNLAAGKQETSSESKGLFGIFKKKKKESSDLLMPAPLSDADFAPSEDFLKSAPVPPSNQFNQFEDQKNSFGKSDKIQDYLDVPLPPENMGNTQSSSNAVSNNVMPAPLPVKETIKVKSSNLEEPSQEQDPDFGLPQLPDLDELKKELQKEEEGILEEQMFEQPTVDTKKEHHKWKIFDVFSKKDKVSEEFSARRQITDQPPLPPEPPLPPHPSMQKQMGFQTQLSEQSQMPQTLQRPLLENFPEPMPMEPYKQPISPKFDETNKNDILKELGLEEKQLPPVPAVEELSYISSKNLPEPLSDFSQPALNILKNVEETQQSLSKKQTTKQTVQKPSKSIQKQLDRKEQLQSEILALKQEVANLKADIVSLNAEIEEKRRLMDENEKLLDQKEQAIDEKMKSADEKIKQLETLKNQIESTRLDIKQKSEQLDKAKVLAEQVYADRQVVDKRMSELEAKELSFADREKKLQEKESQLKELEAGITQRETQIKTLESQLKEKEASLVNQSKGLEDDEFKKYMDEILKEMGETSKKHSIDESSQTEDYTNPELVGYINRHLRKGFKQDRIMNALKGAGWSDDEIKLAMNQALISQDKASSLLGQSASQKPRMLPPVVSDVSENENSIKLQQITGLLAKARTLVNQRAIPRAQEALMQAKIIFDSLYMEEHKKEMLKYEIQDIKAEIDLALLS